MLITHYILLFLKPFQYCIKIIEYIYNVDIMLEISSCDLLIDIIDYFGDD